MNRLLKKILAFTTATALAGVVLIVFLNVVMRYVLNSGLTWSEEIAVYLFVWVIFLGAILAALEDLHIKIDLLTSKLPPTLRKVLFVLANLCIIFSMGVLIKGGWTVVEVTQHNVSAATGIPFSFISISVVVFAVCIIFITLYQTYLGLKPANKETQDEQ